MDKSRFIKIDRDDNNCKRAPDIYIFFLLFPVRFHFTGSLENSKTLYSNRLVIVIIIFHVSLSMTAPKEQAFFREQLSVQVALNRLDEQGINVLLFERLFPSSVGEANAASSVQPHCCFANDSQIGLLFV